MANNIFPMAYKPKPGLTVTLQFVRLPEVLREGLHHIRAEHGRLNNYTVNATDNYPTGNLKPLLLGVMDDVVLVNSFSDNGGGNRWLVTAKKFDEKEWGILAELMRQWVRSKYYYITKKNDAKEKGKALNERIDEFCQNVVSGELLKAHAYYGELEVIDENGQATSDGYNVLPYLICNTLRGQTIELFGTELRLCYLNDSYSHSLMTAPLLDTKTGHYYSFVFDFSVQTVPKDCEPMLNFTPTIRRWIPGSRSDCRPYLSEQINVHCKVADDRYCKVALEMKYGDKGREYFWNSSQKKAYNAAVLTPLPNAEEVVLAPENYFSQCLLPYKVGVPFKKPFIGTGVSVKDKYELYYKVKQLIVPYIEADVIEFEHVSLRYNLNNRIQNKNVTPEDYSSPEAFRQWVKQCTETDHLVFEIYGLTKYVDQANIMDEIAECIRKDFGENEPSSCMTIDIVKKDIGSIGDPLLASGKNGKPTWDEILSRKSEIIARLRTQSPAVVTGCMIVLPDKNTFSNSTDPKYVIRNAFAFCDRVTQFIVPDQSAKTDKNKENEQCASKEIRVRNAVLDLYRQLGVVTLRYQEMPENSYFNIPAFGVSVLPKVIYRYPKNKDKNVPIVVEVDFKTGKTQVFCKLFEKNPCNYREACIQIARLHEKQKKSEDVNGVYNVIQQLSAQYNSPEKPVLIVVESNENVRNKWVGISNSAISRYEGDAHYPTQVLVSEAFAKVPLSKNLLGTGIRIVRVRDNKEVPDYFTARKENEEFVSASGLYQYNDTYYGISARANDPKYVGSYKSSRVQQPAKNFAEKNMVEIYPIQLQEGDEPKQWVGYVQGLRYCSTQFDVHGAQATSLPLPLHLIGKLKEYLFEL